MISKFETRHIPAYLMVVVIILVALALNLHSWIFVYPAIIIQLVITFIDPLLFQRKIRLAGLFIYSLVEFLIAFVIWGLIEVVKMVV